MPGVSAWWLVTPQGTSQIRPKAGPVTSSRAMPGFSAWLPHMGGRSVELFKWGTHAENTGIALEEVTRLALARH